MTDQCPLDPEDKDAFEDENGCPDPDNDKDGILDVVDRCPMDPEDKDGFEDDNGCPDPDNDKDGFLDPNDKCPLEPEVVNGVDDEDGCPDEGGKVRLTKDKIEILDKVYFDFNKATIKPVSFDILNQVAQVLKGNPQLVRIRIEGHTDSKGNDAYNKKLSQARAESVRNYLVAKGIDSNRLVPAGFGEEQPVATNTTNDGRSENRRVEFVILENTPR